MAHPCPHQEENAGFSYLEYHQRAVPQIVPQLLVPLPHIPIRVRRSPELRQPTLSVLPAQRGVFRYRQTEGSIGDVVRPSRGHGLKMLLRFFARGRTEEGRVKEGLNRGEEVGRCDVRDEPWDEFRAGQDERCDRDGFLDRFFEVDSLEDYLRDVWSARHEEVREDEVCEELKGVSALPTKPGSPRSASMGCVPRIRHCPRQSPPLHPSRF